MFFLIGCSNNTAKDRVIYFLGEYQELSADVMASLEQRLDNEQWNNEQKEKYRQIMKRQYRDLKYNIMDERFNNGTQYIDVKIEVYDFYMAQESVNYYEDNTSKSYLDFKLDAMMNTNDRIEYLLTFKLEKDDNNKYQIIDLQDSDIEKIHGIYH